MAKPQRLQDERTPLQVGFVGGPLPTVTATKEGLPSLAYWLGSQTLNRSVICSVSACNHNTYRFLCQQASPFFPDISILGLRDALPEIRP